MTLLNEADAIFLGDVATDAVYLGDTMVWSAEFRPNRIPGLMTWIDPTQDFLLEGQKIASYTEHSAARRVFTSPDARPEFQPIFRTSPPRIEFPASHFGLVTHNVNLGSNGLTFVVVGRAADNSNYPMKVVSGPDADGFEFRSNGTGSEIVERYQTHGIVFSHPAPDPMGVDILLVMRVTSGVRTDVWTNSLLHQDARAAPGHNAPLDLWVARREGGYYWRGLLAELLVYAGPISDDNLTKLTQYLKTKHQLASI